jgi:hypothetical protein
MKCKCSFCLLSEPVAVNCKLVRYCNIWLSRWTPSSWFFPVVSPRVDFWHFRKFCGTLTDIGPWSLGRTSGTITVSVCEHCYVHFDDNIDLVTWLLWEDVGCVGLLLKSCHILVYSAFSNSFGVVLDWCYVAEGLVTSQELKIKQ